MTAKLERMIPVLMSRDVTRSIAFYVEQLGFNCLFKDNENDPRYVVVRRDSVDIHLQWQDASHWDYPIDRPNYRFAVDDADALYAELSTKNLKTTAIKDTEWGTREFHLYDPDRNGLQFFHQR